MAKQMVFDDEARRPLAEATESGDHRSAQSSPDSSTATAFASSWNTAGTGSVYTRAQFLDWLDGALSRARGGQRAAEPETSSGDVVM